MLRILAKSVHHSHLSGHNVYLCLNGRVSGGNYYLQRGNINILPLRNVKRALYALLILL